MRNRCLWTGITEMQYGECRMIGKIIFIVSLSLLVAFPSFAKDKVVTFCEDPYPPYVYGKMGSEPIKGILIDLLGEIFNRIEFMFVHKRRQFIAHSLDHRIPHLHHAGTNLHAIAAQQDKLCRVGSRFHAANATKGAPGKFRLDQRRDLHAIP